MERTTNDTLELLIRVAGTLTGQQYELESWNPGDGRRVRMCGHKGSTNVSPASSKRDLETWLRAFILGAETVLGHERVMAIFAERGNPWTGKQPQVVAGFPLSQTL